MSPAERRFWLAAQRRVSGLQPDVQAAMLRAFRILRDSLSEADLARIIASGTLAALLNEAFDQATLDRAFLPYRQAVRDVVNKGFDLARKDLPKAGKVDGTIAVAFDHLSPKVIDAIRTMETKSLQTLQSDVRDTVRAYVENGLRDGKNPRVIARDLRAVIGMSPTQTANAAKFQAKLEAQGLPADKIAKQVAAYQKKAVALNAETNARTATLDAYKQGQQLAWNDAINKGIVDADRLTKSWKGVMDDRERPEHVAMQDETVGYDEPFSNGEMVPGESTYNCRCVVIYRQMPAERTTADASPAGVSRTRPESVAIGSVA